MTKTKEQFKDVLQGHPSRCIQMGSKSHPSGKTGAAFPAPNGSGSSIRKLLLTPQWEFPHISVKIHRIKTKLLE